MRQIESEMQSACVYWFRLQYPKLARLLFAVPNGGYRNKQTAKRMHKEGVVSGVADLILLVPSKSYHGLCVEMKTHEGRQTENQKSWQTIVEQQGYLYKVCRSTTEFFFIINKYLENSLYICKPN